MKSEENKIEYCTDCNNAILENLFDDCFNEELDRYICEDCIKNYISCYNCGDLEHKEDSFMFYGDYYCDNCKDNLFSNCDDCYGTVLNNDLEYIHNLDRSVCNNCFDNYQNCALCNDIIHCDDTYTAINGHNSEIELCESCHNYETSYCDNCGRSILSDYVCDNLCDFCEDNGAEDNGASDLIHNYGYQPSPNFKYIKRYELNKEITIGIELETENEDFRKTSEALQDISNLTDIFYYKRDSSLQSGVELVSHPFTESYYKKNIDTFNNILKILRQNSFQSHNGGRCGFHIHVSKKFLTRLDVLKLFQFFSNNYSFILSISQRTESSFNNWSSLITDYNTIKSISKYKSHSNRGAINCNPQNTIEFRIFRGNLLDKRFHKNIEFIYSIIHYIKQIDYKNSSLKSYLRYLEQHQKEYKNLNHFILEKKILDRRTFKIKNYNKLIEQDI